ncbi:MAG: hypothetical protein OXC83_09640 [Chloroflexi bacterium]|nr:hypothetical protein [Chloroflexota bacterium]
MLDINDLFPNGLSIQDAIDMLQPVAIYVIGIAVYAVFVFNFYRFVALRDMFAFDVYRYEESRHRAIRSFIHVVAYILKYLIVFPMFAFFWFAVLTLMLTFMSEGRDISDTLLIALATVSAIRFSAYYDEDLSRDLAKILPFALLALFLIDASFFNFGDSLEKLEDVGDHAEAIVYYLVFLIALELVLRFGFGFSVWLFTKRPVRTKARPVIRGDDSAAEMADEAVAPEKDGEVGDEGTARESSG